jgi:catechol 2,3-dioxygenase-like lactoylglutathione lyase family enzyme
VASPTIVAPVSRHLDVAHLARSVTFYRDILGFEVHAHADHSAELTLGPARLTLGSRPPDTEGEGRAILFFETDDVAATYDILAARGAEPTPPEVVNWIKMRMIEVRDPEGNTLWFGNAVGGGHERSPHQRMLRKVMPELPLSDVTAGVVHYRDVLGFEVNYSQDDIGVMDRDGMRVLLIARTARHTGIGSCAFYVTDADALHAELVARRANVQGPPVSKPWGLREFSVLDPEGNRLTFAQTFE